MLTRENYEVVLPPLRAEIEQFSGAVREALTALPDIRDDELEATRLEVLETKRDTFRVLRHDGVVSTEVFRELTAEIDALISRR